MLVGAAEDGTISIADDPLFTDDLAVVVDSTLIDKPLLAVFVEDAVFDAEPVFVAVLARMFAAAFAATFAIVLGA